MNHTTKVSVSAHHNGDLTFENEDGSITVHADGVISISTVAPIQLTGDSLGKLDHDPQHSAVAFVQSLMKRGKKS